MDGSVWNPEVWDPGDWRGLIRDVDESSDDECAEALALIMGLKTPRELVEEMGYGSR